MTKNPKPKTKTKTKPKKAVTASPILKRTPALDYAAPKVSKVATKIDAVEPAFIPKPSEEVNSTSVSVSANLKEQIRLPHRGTVEIDCGFSMDLPAGFHAVVTAAPQLASRGLLITTPNFYGEGSVKVGVMNVGREILTVDHQQIFATMVVQPAYSFEWI